MGELRRLGAQGDVPMSWNPDDPADVERARALFVELIGKGFVAFRTTGRKGDKGERIYEFDPKAAEIVMVPKIAGGLL